jgi:hypothetical protein
MFGWSKPQKPLDDAAKAWVEGRLGWLSDQFGAEVFTRRAVLLPTTDCFPDRVDGSEESVRRLLDRVCRYMDVEPDRVELQLYRDTRSLYVVNDQGRPLPMNAAGLYDEQSDSIVIHIESSQLAHTCDLIGTMAHELAHLRLLGEGRLSGDEYDNELLTDLTAVFHGFGVFLGNSPRNWDGMYSKWPGTTSNRPEYMILPMYAYVLAHAAWFRGVSKPDWMRYLSSDLKACFKPAIRYLLATGDSTYSPSSFKS